MNIFFFFLMFLVPLCAIDEKLPFEINADQVVYQENEIALDGHVKIFGQKKSDTPLDISCDAMTIKMTEKPQSKFDHLVAQGNVEAKTAAFRTLGDKIFFNNGQLVVYGNPCRLENQNKDILEAERFDFDTTGKIFHASVANGTLSLSSTPLQYKCNELTLEEDKNLITMTSSPGKQIFLEGELGEIYTDTLRLTYQTNDGKRTPTKLILSGHIQILNRYDQNLKTSGSVLQSALADELEYNPETKEMVLTASQGQRVLYSDQINGIQMSAPSIKINLATQKPVIQGQGDVRFAFMEKELEHLKLLNKKVKK